MPTYGHEDRAASWARVEKSAEGLLNASDHSEIASEHELLRLGGLVTWHSERVGREVEGDVEPRQCGPWVPLVRLLS